MRIAISLICAGAIAWMLHAAVMPSPRAIATGPAQSPTTATTEFTDADFNSHIIALRKRLSPESPFHILVEKPFVVIGDEPPTVVRRRARDTVRFAVERLKR